MKLRFSVEIRPNLPSPNLDEFGNYLKLTGLLSFSELNATIYTLFLF
jgi:hypothetical protein